MESNINQSNIQTLPIGVRYQRLRQSFDKSVKSIFDSVPSNVFANCLPSHLQEQHPSVLSECYSKMRISLEHHLAKEFEEIITPKLRQKLNFLDLIVQMEDGSLICPKIETGQNAVHLSNETVELKKKLKTDMRQLLESLEQDNEKKRKENAVLKERSQEALKFVTESIRRLEEAVEVIQNMPVADTADQLRNVQGSETEEDNEGGEEEEGDDVYA